MSVRQWKKHPVRAWVPTETHAALSALATKVGVQLDQPGLHRNDLLTWMIHWVVTLPPEQAIEIAKAGKAMEEAYDPESGKLPPVSGLPVVAPGRTGDDTIARRRAVPGPEKPDRKPGKRRQSDYARSAAAH